MVLEVKAAPTFMGKLGWDGVGVPPLAAKQINTSWRQPEIWRKYLQCFKTKGRVSAGASRFSQLVQLLSWFPGQCCTLSPRAPTCLGCQVGTQQREGHAAHSRHSAETERLENKLPVVRAMENMQEHSFPQYTCPEPAPPPVPHAFGSQHSPSPICVNHEQGDFVTFIPTINPHCLRHGTLQNSLQDHLDAEQM